MCPREGYNSFVRREMTSRYSDGTVRQSQTSQIRPPSPSLDHDAAVTIAVSCPIAHTFVSCCAGVQLSPATLHVPRGVPTVSRKRVKSDRTAYASRGFAAGTGHSRLAGSGKGPPFQALQSTRLPYVAASSTWKIIYCVQQAVQGALYLKTKSTII